MPRKARPVPPCPVGPSSVDFVLRGRAKELFDKVTTEWRLDAVALAILQCACESLQRAEEAARIVEAEGLTQKTRYGETKVHSAAKLEMDHRAAAAASLQKLGLNLQ